MLWKKKPFEPTHKDSSGKGNKTFQPWRVEGRFLGYVRPCASPRRVVLFFHGGVGEALDRAWVDELVPERDVLVLAEYSGYGAREGKIDHATWLAEARELVELTKDQWGTLPVLAVGEGVGCGVASYLASLKAVDRLALIAPPETIESGWWSKNRFGSLEYVHEASAPLYIVHGTMDEYAPVESGHAVLKAYAGEQKQMDEVPGFGHTNLDQAILHSPFTVRFREFISN